MKNRELKSFNPENSEKIDCETPFGQEYFWKELEIIVMDGAQIDSEKEE